MNSPPVAKPNLPVIIRHPDSNGFLRVNEPFTAQLGYQVAELKTQSLIDWIRPDDRPGFEAMLKNGGHTQAAHQAQDGTWIDFDWRVREEPSGQIVLGVRHHDQASSRRQPTALAPDRPATMHEILEEMARIIEDERPGLLCSVLLLDDAGDRIVGGAGPSLPDKYNRAVEGLRIGPFVGSCGTAAFWNERVIVENIQEDPLWADLRGIASEAGVAACWSHPILSINGRVLGATALYCRTPRAPTQQELDGLGTAARMFGLAIDHAYAEQALEKAKAAQAKRELELEDQLHQAAKMEALGVLAGGVAHDFNNMLVSVLGNAEVAMKSIPRSSETYTVLSDIVEASRRASELCNQMLAYAGRGKISTEHFECNELINGLIGLLQAAISKKSQLEFRLSTSPLYVDADKTQLAQVVMNLITNASEALMDEPGQITTSSGRKFYSCKELEPFQVGDSTAEGEYVWFQVSDTGTGMSPETMERIFDPFFTTKISGRGLGLAAARGIILQHHGHIHIETEVNRGTTFQVLLPSTTGRSQPAPAGTQADSKPDTPTILVVDDEEQVRKTMTRVLRLSGFEVVSAQDGHAAISIFRSRHQDIDCVLLDFSMPDLDGEETFRELIKIDPDVKVILNSGYAQKDVLDRIDGAGFAGLLHKPTPVDTLVTTLNTVIRQERNGS